MQSCASSLVSRFASNNLKTQTATHQESPLLRRRYCQLSNPPPIVCIYALGYASRMLRHETQARITAASETCRRLGISQSQIAKAVGASQSQVSRVLGGRGVIPTRLLDEICGFVERYEAGVTAEAVRENDDLVEAV